MIAIQLAVVVLLGSVAWAMPSLTKPTLPFGVRVPPDRQHDPAIDRARRQYRLAVTAVTVLVLGVAGLVDRTGDAAPAALVPLGFVLLTWTCYYRAHRQLRAVKHEHAWYSGHRQVAVADTGLRTAPPAYPWAWALVPVVIVGATLTGGIIAYPHLAARIPMHYSSSGVDRWADRTPLTAFSGVLTQVALTVLLLWLCATVTRSRPDLDADDPAGSADRYRRFVGQMQRALLVLTAAGDVSLGAVQALSWAGTRSAALVTVTGTVPTLVGLGAVLAVAVRAGQGGSRLRTPTGAPRAGDIADRDDDDRWYAGGLYVNPNDPAFLVPKRYGIGWTLNFAHPAAWLLLAALIAVPILVRIATR